MDASHFLEQYRHDIKALPLFGAAGGLNAASWLRNLDTDQKRIFITLLPQAAALKHRRPELSTAELIEAVKCVSIEKIDRVLNNVDSNSCSFSKQKSFCIT